MCTHLINMIILTWLEGSVKEANKPTQTMTSFIYISKSRGMRSRNDTGRDCQQTWWSDDHMAHSSRPITSSSFWDSAWEKTWFWCILASGDTMSIKCASSHTVSCILFPRPHGWVYGLTIWGGERLWLILYKSKKSYGMNTYGYCWVVIVTKASLSIAVQDTSW